MRILSSIKQTAFIVKEKNLARVMSHSRGENVAQGSRPMLLTFEALPLNLPLQVLCPAAARSWREFLAFPEKLVTLGVPPADEMSALRHP